MQSADERREWVLAALDEYEVRLLRYSLRLLGGDEDLARDAVQHAFVKLCGEARNATEGVPYSADRLPGWLFRVCRNRAVDHLRHAGREQSLEVSLAEEGGEPKAPADQRPGPAEASESRELAVFLRGLVAELPPSQREAIDLWCEGFSYRQIAEITSRQEGHVRVLVHRGLTTVRRHPRVRGWLESMPPETTTANDDHSSIKAKSNGTTRSAAVPSRREGTTLRATP
jgi:RNA polymerase sigma-70 factor (ECF subfamily)